MDVASRYSLVEAAGGMLNVSVVLLSLVMATAVSSETSASPTTTTTARVSVSSGCVRVDFQELRLQLFDDGDSSNNSSNNTSNNNNILRRAPDRVIADKDKCSQ